MKDRTLRRDAHEGLRDGHQSPDHETRAGHPLLVLQREAGNRGVTRAIKRSQLARDATAHGHARHHPAAPAAPAKAPTNDPNMVKAAWADDLLGLYVTDEATYSIHRPGAECDYTRDWIRGTGQPLILEALTEKYHEKLQAGRRADVEWGLELLKQYPGDDLRKAQLRNLIEEELRNTPGVPPLSTKEHNDLVGDTRSAISDSFTAFAYAAQENKEAIRREIAEQAEMMQLLLEIGFSIASPFLGKALEKGFEKLAEFDKLGAGVQAAAKKVLTKKTAEVAIEDTFKVGMAHVKKVLPEVYGQTEVENFIDQLVDHAKDAAKEAAVGLHAKTDVEIAMVCGYFQSMTRPYYYTEIKEKVERYERYVEGIGSITTDDYEHPSTTDFYAAYVYVKGGMHLALVSESEAGIFFNDWVPADMAEMAEEKTKAQSPQRYIRTLTRDDLVVPRDWRDRFEKGPLDDEKRP